MSSGGSRKLAASGDPSRLSVGKPSFKLRLEAYYRLVAPDTLQASSSGHSWRERFDQIWDKYGGSHEGEKKLAGKLAKKYGTLVVLETVAMAQASTAASATDTTTTTKRSQIPEKWFQLNAQEKQSCCIDFMSDSFDPVAALRSPTKNVEDKNQALFAEIPAGLLDRVDQFRAYLPPSDPLFRPAATRRSTSSAAPSSSAPKAPSIWANIAGPGTASDDHPYSILYQAAFVRKRARIRVVTRYLNGIRGTLTGQLVAYDKHMNLLLRDAEETCYGKPPKRKDYSLTNAEQEKERRLRLYQRQQQQQPPRHRRRLPQVMVRGDNVVLVYFAAAEESAWPVTAKSPAQSQYRDEIKRVDDRHRVGTPGSLTLFTAPRTCTHQATITEQSK